MWCAGKPRPGEEEARARCSGEFACPYQKIEHLKLFASRRAFDIDGLGGEADRVLLRRGVVKEPADIFTLPARNNKIKLEEIEGYGETSVRNLFGAIEHRRRIALERFIYALGMRHVGRRPRRLALARRIWLVGGLPRRLRQGRSRRRGGDRRDGCARPDRRHRDQGDRGLFRREPQPRHWSSG